MKTLKLNASLDTQPVEAYECFRLGFSRADRNMSAWEVAVVSGSVWLSFESPLGKYSSSPLIDVVVKAGQSYVLPMVDSKRVIILSTFEKSVVRFSTSSR